MESRVTTPQPLSGQEAFFIVHNQAAGQHQHDDSAQRAQALLAAAGRRSELIGIDRQRSPVLAARQAVHLAKQQGGIVVAMGGDGTLNAVCQQLLPSGLSLGVIPQGTFNYFSRNLGIPQQLDAAVGCLLDPLIEPVQVGVLNERVFLVNASLGLYPKLLEEREMYKQRYGRNRAVALYAALATLLRAHRQFDLTLEQGKRHQTLRTVSLVVGNNALQLDHIGITEASELQRGKLVAIAARPRGTLALYGLLLQGFLSRLGEDEQVSSFAFQQLRLAASRRRRRVKVALDGEVLWMQGPLDFRVAEQRLPVLVPRDPGQRERQ